MLTPLLAELVLCLHVSLTTAVKLGMGLGYLGVVQPGILAQGWDKKSSGEAITEIEEGIETSAVLEEFGCDWKAGAVVAFWAHSGWQIQRRLQKSWIKKSCGAELPRVPQDLQVPRMNVVSDEQKPRRSQLCLRDNKRVSVLWRFGKLCLELCLMSVLSHSLIPLKFSKACTDGLGQYPALKYRGGRSVCAALRLVWL